MSNQNNTTTQSKLDVQDLKEQVAALQQNIDELNSNLIRLSNYVHELKNFINNHCHPVIGSFGNTYPVSNPFEK